MPAVPGCTFMWEFCFRSDLWLVAVSFVIVVVFLFSLLLSLLLLMVVEVVVVCSMFVLLFLPSC